MFEKVGLMAERAATSVSRRNLLGRLGGGAMAAATLLAGVIAFPAHAAPLPPCPSGTKRCSCGKGLSNCCYYNRCQSVVYNLRFARVSGWFWESACDLIIQVGW